ncbi:MAG: FAD-dependent oxidoreductase, partial [Desulfitobacteriaceae bacterium]
MWPETVIETDVLIIGGGIAGCLAAIRARELGVDVTLVEKGNTRRSGSAATGIDHCWAYIPPIHGPEYTVEDMVEDHTRNAGGFIYQDLVHTIASNSYQRILDLERFGVPMRDENGAFRLVKKIHREPSFVHFAGRDMKVKLTNEARKRAVRILNRVMVTDLLVRDGEIIGCMGVNTRQPEVFLFKAKSIVITTGSVFRLYRNPTGMSFNTGFPPSETGDGHAMAFRSGV